MPLQKTRKRKQKKRNLPKRPSYLSGSKGYIEVIDMAMPHIVNAIKMLEAELEVLKRELDFREFARRL